MQPDSPAMLGFRKSWEEVFKALLEERFRAFVGSSNPGGFLSFARVGIHSVDSSPIREVLKSNVGV